jgi:hemolysin activation/secretion protein
MVKKIVMLVMFIISFSLIASLTNINDDRSQQDIQREERRRADEQLKQMEKTNKFEERVLNEINPSASSAGSKIRFIWINGNTILSKRELEKIRKKYIGKNGGENVLNLMKEFENIYLEKGYIATRVKIDMAKSDMKIGRVTLQVIEGFIEDIRFKENGFSDKRKIFASMPGKKGKKLNINDLDQGIDNLNSVSSNNAKFELVAGEEFGGSIVEIENHRSKKITGVVNFNDLGQKSTGRNRIKATVIIEDLLGLNDSMTGTYQRKFGRHKGREYSGNFSFYYKIPIKYWEIAVWKDQSEYLTSINALNRTYRYSGVSNSMNYSLRRVIHRNGNGKTSLGATLILKETKNYFEDIKLITGSRKLSILKIDLSHNRRFLGGLLSVNMAYHEGLKMNSAERDKGKDPYTPRAQFQKYTLDVNWYKPFMIKNKRFTYRFSMGLQYSDDILYSSEKLSIGDDTTVRGFKENSIMGEKGFYIRNELSHSFKYIEPFIAYDIGRVKNVYKDDQYKKKGNELSGITAGVRINIKNCDVSLSYSKPVTAPSYVKKNSHELYFTVSLKF